MMREGKLPGGEDKFLPYLGFPLRKQNCFFLLPFQVGIKFINSCSEKIQGELKQPEVMTLWRF